MPHEHVRGFDPGVLEQSVKLCRHMPGRRRSAVRLGLAEARAVIGDGLSELGDLRLYELPDLEAVSEPADEHDRGLAGPRLPGDLGAELEAAHVDHLRSVLSPLRLGVQPRWGGDEQACKQGEPVDGASGVLRAERHDRGS
jgi:hypothetical protein